MPISIYDPRTMIEAVRVMPPIHTFLKDTFFKNVITFPTKTVEVDFYKGKRKLAPFVHPKIGGKTIENQGYQTNIFTPELVAPDKITTADDLMKRLQGEPLYGGMTPAQRGAQKLGQDLAELDEMITRREEWMCAQAIFSGQIPIKGEGLDYTIDFSFTNKDTLVGNNVWSNAASDPLKDLETWYQRVQINGMVNPDMCIMSDDAASAFINHAKVQKVLDLRLVNSGAIDPKQLPNGVTYIGRINKLGLDIYQYNEWYLDDWTDPAKPENKPLVPAKTVTLISSRARYSMAYGAITLIDKDSEAFYTIEGSRVPDSWIAKKPARRFLQMSSKPLPVPHEVDSWFVATVL
ncbi:Capsid protein of prophage [Desulfitobacterium hafniense]|uniref:Capsid protein of prophage n=1 Tax=Desulfitobacterium hafniense TaxID=49338 RepID=A0A098AXD3_DESHA|nr:major capsid protein [Desulfitobacterium hafniense]CDX01294.1 Capsid protein of prophage [Desulfitobacterium hafniense]